MTKNKYLVLDFLFILIISQLHPTLANKHGYIGDATVKAIRNDLPTFIDLMVYLPLLNRIVEYCELHRNVVTLNLAHGLFLMNVNLESFSKDIDIPAVIRSDLIQLLERSSKIIDAFNSGKGKMRRAIAVLTNNVTQWSSRLPNLNLNLLKRTYKVAEYPAWTDYLQAVEDLSNGIPTPVQSDRCVSSLSESPSGSGETPRCLLPADCQRTVLNGTDFGYFLTHRFILLSMARLGRGCTIFSPHEDELFRIYFCEKAFREAQYIARNSFGLVDLMLEQMALCSLDGHAQFLRRSWLTTLLDYQNTSGCFQLHNTRVVEDIKHCDGHATAVGAATYAAAARYLLEKMKRIM